MSCHSLISSSRICPSFAYSCRCLYNVHFLEFWELIKPYDICPTFFIPHMSVATNRPPPQLTCSVRLIRAPLPRSYLSWPSLNSFATSISLSFRNSLNLMTYAPPSSYRICPSLPTAHHLN